MKKHLGLYILGGLIGAGIIFRDHISMFLHHASQTPSAPTPPPPAAGYVGAPTPQPRIGLVTSALDNAQRFAQANTAASMIQQIKLDNFSVPYGGDQWIIADRAIYLLNQISAAAPQCNGDQICKAAHTISDVNPNSTDFHGYANDVTSICQNFSGSAQSTLKPVTKLFSNAIMKAISATKKNPNLTPVAPRSPNLSYRVPHPAAAPAPQSTLAPVPTFSDPDPGFLQPSDDGSGAMCSDDGSVCTDGQGNYFMSDGQGGYTQIDPNIIQSMDATDDGSQYDGGDTGPLSPDPSGSGLLMDANGNYFSPDGTPVITSGGAWS